MIEAFFDEEAGYAVAIEDEVATVRLLVADDAVGSETSVVTRTATEMTYVRRAISWGVWGRVWTLSNSACRDTVAFGFSSEGLYAGPTLRAGDATRAGAGDMVNLDVEEQTKSLCEVGRVIDGGGGAEKSQCGVRAGWNFLSLCKASALG